VPLAGTAAFERNDLARVIGEYANALEAEIDKDLRANSALALNEPLTVEVAIDLLAIVKMDARQLARFGIARVDLKATSGMVQVNENAAIGFVDSGKRSFDDVVAVARGGTENVAGKTVGVHANERRTSLVGRLVALRNVTADERDVDFVVGFAGVRDHLKISVPRG